MSEIVYDIETSGLEQSSKLWSIAINCDESTKCYTAYPLSTSDGLLPQALSTLLEAETHVGFNNISFDAPFLEHKWGINLPYQLDLMIVLKLMYSKDTLFNIDRGIEGMPKKLWGSFSLEAFGWRLGYHKIEYHNYSNLTKEMIEYNIQDTNLTKELYDWAKAQEIYPSERVISLEMSTAKYLTRQEANGFRFDINKARELATAMRLEMLKIERELGKKFKPLFLPDGKPKKAKGIHNKRVWLDNSDSFEYWSTVKPYKLSYSHYKNGKVKLPKKPIKWSSAPLKMIYKRQQSEYQPITYTKFSASSRTHIKIWLQHHYGWEPTVFTDKGNPKVDYDTLGSVDYTEGKLLERYLKLSKDLSQLQTGNGSLINKYNPDTQAIHHSCDTMGTNTGRMAHSKPNLGQIPSTEEFRSLFIAPEEYSIVGADLSAQELRVLAHYLYPYDNGRYAEAVLKGDKSKGTDIHSMNMKAMNLATRDEAKTAIYAILYGSSTTRIGYSLWTDDVVIEYTDKEFEDTKDKLIRRIDMARNEGKIVDMPNGSLLFPIAKDKFVPFTDLLVKQAIYGQRVYDSFVEKTVGYKELQEAIQKEAKSNGYILGLDGRRLTVRSAHSALNLLFQGAGAVITKYWVREFDTRMKGYKYNDDWWSNAIIHDEMQTTVKDEYVHEVGKLMRESARCLDKQLGLNVPQDAEYKWGSTWWQTH